jgi:hypothetical protein
VLRRDRSGYVGRRRRHKLGRVGRGDVLHDDAQAGDLVEQRDLM